VIVGAANVVRVLFLKSKYDAVLVVYTDCVASRPGAGKGVKMISGREAQVVELGYRVNLVQLAPDDGPQRFWNPAGCPAIYPVPDVPRRVVGKRTNHGIAL